MTGRWLGACSIALGLACAARAQTPAAPEPSWFKLSGEARVRYETLDGQFRAGGQGGDQALAFRTLVRATATSGPVAFTLELQDSRHALDDPGSPLSTSLVNPLDVLQAQVRITLPDLPGHRRADLTVGRQTVSIGSRRVIERVDFANVIFAYTGLHLQARTMRGDEWHVLAVAPVGRFPNDRPSLGEDRLSGDEEEWGRRFWGLHYRRSQALGAAVPDVWAEAFFYRLEERDTPSVQTPNRDYAQPGVRLFRAPSAGRVDFDVEASWRSGSRRQTAAPTDTRDLTVEAATLHAHVGYTFDDPWRTRISLDYDYASGDGNPADGRFTQYERLFGSRRTDLGNTGIHGPLTPTNLRAPGARIEVTPSPRMDVRLAYKAALLDDPRDAWTVARVRDPTGAAGRFIGHTWDMRTRVWLRPEALRLEFGASALIRGRFAREAPNASGQGDTTYGYVQLTRTF